MADWTKVITHPLGLAGFALFVVFMLLTRRQTDSQPTWLKALFVIMAVVALFGGIWLASLQTTAPQDETRTPQAKEIQPTASQPQTSLGIPSSVEQTTTGAGSPAVSDVKGDVNISISQPQGSDTPTSPPLRNSNPPKPTSKRPAKPDAPPEERKPSEPTVKQQTSGAASPAISGVGGDVSVTITNR